MTYRKGILLAGGSGTRLYPVTIGGSKQLMPVYDKPMVYYPLSTLMQAGIREIAIITTPDHQAQYVRLLGSGAQWGLSLSYISQPSPDGLAQAYLLARDFLNGAPSVMVLGDNIFCGQGMSELLAQAGSTDSGATVFGYRVPDPERYGVIGMNALGQVTEIVEKPAVPPSNLAITGLYFLDDTAPERAREVRPSERGELEITSLLDMYLQDRLLAVQPMGRGIAWFDTGTHSSLLDAGNFVRSQQTRLGIQTGCPEEIAYRYGWISPENLQAQAHRHIKTEYGRYLLGLLSEVPGLSDNRLVRQRSFCPPVSKSA
ncbi:MAG TPA: glucose-1-phosphate thymidylyltransferase [Rhodobacteraceae bacterium]|nr:glucose-1-phosphate thymidylyltransferase [Paracoccaceae bacterium]